jgi:hypothetical protein
MCDSGKSLFGTYSDNFIQVMSLLSKLYSNKKALSHQVFQHKFVLLQNQLISQ